MYILEKIALWLTIIGGLNWGLVGLLDFNLVSSIFGELGIWARIIYILIGLSALYLIIAQFFNDDVVVVKER